MREDIENIKLIQHRQPVGSQRREQLNSISRKGLIGTFMNSTRLEHGSQETN